MTDLLMGLIDEWTQPSDERLEYPPGSVGAELFAWLDKGYAMLVAHGMAESEAASTVKIAALI